MRRGPTHSPRHRPREPVVSRADGCHSAAHQGATPRCEQHSTHNSRQRRSHKCPNAAVCMHTKSVPSAHHAHAHHSDSSAAHTNVQRYHAQRRRPRRRPARTECRSIAAHKARARGAQRRRAPSTSCTLATQAAPGVAEHGSLRAYAYATNPGAGARPPPRPEAGPTAKHAQRVPRMLPTAVPRVVHVIAAHEVRARGSQRRRHPRARTL